MADFVPEKVHLVGSIGLDSVEHIFRTVGRMFGRRLRRGDRVTTGVTTGIYLAQPGDRLAAHFGPHGRVGLDFARA